MALDEIIHKLREVAINLAPQVPGARWFLFGSTVRGKDLPNDVDVLVVYQKDKERLILRNGLALLLEKLPLHLVLMREDEAAETQFIENQRALCISPVK